MSSIVFDFKDINARVNRREVPSIGCEECGDDGWIIGYGRNRNAKFYECPACRNPHAKPPP